MMRDANKINHGDELLEYYMVVLMLMKKAKTVN